MSYRQGNGMPRARERNTRAEGTWEKVWTRRRGKAPLLERVRGGGADHHRKLPGPEHAHAHRLSEVRAALAQATVSENPLAHLGETGHFSCRLPVARHLLCGLRTSGG